MRQRAVAALGELGDARAVDTFLKLAGEDGHALQESAAEAIGHLKKSPQADAIFRLLERLSKGTGGTAKRAIIGLRWFDTPSAWDIIRAKLMSRAGGWMMDQIKQTAAEQLGFNDDPTTRDLLLKTIRTNGDGDIVAAAFTSCVRLWGKESLEPHYNVIQNREAEYMLESESALENVVKTVAEKGDALRIMKVFPKCITEVQEPLEAALLTRPTLPVKEAAAALSHADEGTVRLATGLLGKVKNPDAAAKKAVGDALAKWWATWQDRRAKVDRVENGEESLAKAASVVEILLWTAGRVGVPGNVLSDVARSCADDPRAKSIRLEAIRCLASGKPTAATFDVLEQLAVGNDADVRVLATELVARLDPKRAAGLAEKTLSDRPSFERLVAAKAVSAAKLGPVAAQVHYQPVVLQVLIDAKDIAPLAAVARDKKAPDAARLGAVEGLAVMATESAEKVLSEIGGAKDDDKDLRKAAFRALRRSKRARQKVAKA